MQKMYFLFVSLVSFPLFSVSPAVSEAIACDSVPRQLGGIVRLTCATETNPPAEISCAFNYEKQKWQKGTTVSFGLSDSVEMDSSVKQTCSSDANPPVSNYTWYRVDGSQMIPVESSNQSVITYNDVKYCCRAKNSHGEDWSRILVPVCLAQVYTLPS